MRINRSAQVEGVFGVIKQDMDYGRVRRKGLENVSYECMLACLGYNICKLFTLIAGKGNLIIGLLRMVSKLNLPE